MNNRSIGIFDSGVGGLTVLSELRKALPMEDFIYFGDTARVPYGAKSRDAVLQYSVEAAHFLREKGIKILVIACNTASAFALDYLKKDMDIPVIGVIYAGAKACVRATKERAVGVIGTKGTVRSGAYERALLNLQPSLKIKARACPLFVPIVEEGLVNTDIAENVIEYYLGDFRNSEIDTIILGCTHYPVMMHQIQKVVGDDIVLINPAYETAHGVQRIIEEEGFATSRERQGRVRYYCSDDPEGFIEVGKRIVSMEKKEVELVELSDIIIS